ncbi:hypothetical protein GA0061101_104317 [Rhizobium lusitanum]|uniref:Uncharacterized protein n=1 Tax=Rhizobium lusitanum TaxID=293958 RepID=A0A1C3V729_9HYPH|nr:hypothetical protein GA0061101_104317 [Rhizobium lusitanum]
MYRNVDVFGFDTLRYKRNDASAASPFSPLGRRGRAATTSFHKRLPRGQGRPIVSDCICAAGSYMGIQNRAANDTPAIHAAGFLALNIHSTGETDVRGNQP